MPKVDFKRVETDAEVENIEIKDGQLIYSKSGKTFMDYGDERIPTGSGAGSGTPEVYIQEEQPTTEDWKIWIDTNELNNLGSEVVNTLDGNETNKAPSVKVVKEISQKNVIMGVLNDTLTFKPTSDYTTKNIPITQSILVGNKLSITDNKIVIGKGINIVKVSALINLKSAYSSYTIGISISKNGDAKMVRYHNKLGTNFDSLTIPTFLMNVQEGDKIGLDLYIDMKDTTFEIIKDRTFISVEEIG